MRRLAISAATALLVAGSVLLAAACGSSRSSSASGPPPPFSSAGLSKLPTKNWLTNGGTISNQRYSPLTQINAGNVGRLKGIWHMHLHSGTAGKYSAEGQPLVYKNVMYVVTGADDVFAINAKTGAKK
jgi:glucose dehydrogenase